MITENRKGYMKIKFNSDDHLQLNKPPRFIRSFFEEGGKLYLQVFLNNTLYELQKFSNTKKLIFQKGVTLIKQVHQKNVCFVVIGTSKMLDLNLSRMFVINVMML